jgi:succinyl-diaminopimelate desuccinylase
MNELLQLHQHLIEIPSPNPSGDTRDIAKFVAQWLGKIGATVQVLAPPEKPEAQSVVASIGTGAPVVMLHAHIDTVPVAELERDQWHTDPFSAVVANGKIYGKGSVDDKAPLAAMMRAAKNFAARGKTGTLVVVAAAEEEVGGQLGTKWLAENGHLPMADFIVVGEQTANRVATAHKGVMRATIQTFGQSVHATNPDRGINAINAMAKVVLALEQYHLELASREHPLVGVPTCNVGVIQGGSTANAVADHCIVRLDRRMIPGESPQNVQAELEAVVHSLALSPATAQIGEFLFSSWFESKLETALGRVFLDTSSQITQTEAEPIGYLPGSDAKHLLHQTKGDMVIFGPGSYEVAHAANEYVTVQELEQCFAVLDTFLCEVQDV